MNNFNKELFEEMDVEDLCNNIKMAFYNGNNEHAKTLAMELLDRLEYTGV